MTKSYLIVLSSGSSLRRLWLYIDWQSLADALQKVICDMEMDSNRYLAGIGFLAAQEWHSRMILNVLLKCIHSEHYSLVD